VKRVLHWLILGPLFVIAILFAIGNVTPVSIGLWPLAGYLQAPLSFIVLIFLVIGFFAGAIVAWFGGSRRRQRNREMAERNASLMRQIEELRREQSELKGRLSEANQGATPLSLPPPR
jgi:uncharacterized integral membrane protein